MNRRQMLNSTLLTPIAVVTATGRVAIADASNTALTRAVLNVYDSVERGAVAICVGIG